jgi:glycosyltransferase involved in cell wall biosynthesis
VRIVYLHQYFITPDMAGGARSYEMGRRLVAAGHEVHMVTTDQQPESERPIWRETLCSGIHVHWTPVRYDNSLSYRERIKAFLKFAFRAGRKAVLLKPDVIFATSTPLTIALPAVFASRRSKAPMVFEVRDLWPAVPIAIGAIRNPLLKAAARWLERFAYRNATRIVALAPGMRDEIVASGYPAERVTVIPNGCDFELFSDKSAATNLRQAHDWLGDRPLVVFSGTFGLVNGMDYLVDLSAAIRRLDEEVRIVGIGTGREWDRTRQRAVAAGTLERNLFLLGKRPRREASAWTLAADMNIALFAGPQIVWRDAVQNKFFDSLAAARPVANNFPGWQAKLAESAGAGLILSATDPAAAARDVVQALRDNAWLEKAGRAARKLAVEKFDRDQLAAQLNSVLVEAEQSKHAPSH